MSITIGSPAAITRSPGSWWGEALLGPEATIQNSAWSWPSATSRSRTSRATSASVRPTRGPLAIAATTRSAAWAARRSSATSSASLRIRSRRRIADVSEKRAPGSTRWSPRTNAPAGRRRRRPRQWTRDRPRAPRRGGRRPAPSGPPSPPRSRPPPTRTRPPDRSGRASPRDEGRPASSGRRRRRAARASSAAPAASPRSRRGSAGPRQPQPGARPGRHRGPHAVPRRVAPRTGPPGCRRRSCECLLRRVGSRARDARQPRGQLAIAALEHDLVGGTRLAPSARAARPAFDVQWAPQRRGDPSAVADRTPRSGHRSAPSCPRPRRQPGRAAATAAADRRRRVRARTPDAVHEPGDR